MDLTEAEDTFKKRWQEYTEELCKKIFTTQIIMMVLSGECVISLVLSRHNKNLKPIIVRAPYYNSVYLENKGKYILEARGHANPKDMKKKRETDRDKDREKGPWPLGPGPWPLGSSLICFFSCPWACPM